MLTYRLEFRPAARRDLAKLDRFICSKIVADIEKLANDPRPHGVEKLEAKGKLYRVYVGPGKNYRVVYEFRTMSSLSLW
ncbi:Plasmid stabilization system [Candidatus Sulfopaludibacter sp. SbA4]|nr:Plasmid stabilization system [Candidatus Sulfopaludibacter sp. SbA4]